MRSERNLADINSTPAPRETNAGQVCGTATLDELLEECGRLHGHMCAGQLLGARMAVLGCRLIGLDDPCGTDRKKLVVWGEIDRCMADAVGAVTVVRCGKSRLKYVDYGKVAATCLTT